MNGYIPMKKKVIQAREESKITLKLAGIVNDQTIY